MHRDSSSPALHWISVNQAANVIQLKDDGWFLLLILLLFCSFNSFCFPFCSSFWSHIRTSLHTSEILTQKTGKRELRKEYFHSDELVYSFPAIECIHSVISKVILFFPMVKRNQLNWNTEYGIKLSYWKDPGTPGFIIGGGPRTIWWTNDADEDGCILWYWCWTIVIAGCCCCWWCCGWRVDCWL